MLLNPSTKSSATKRCDNAANKIGTGQTFVKAKQTTELSRLNYTDTNEYTVGIRKWRIHKTMAQMWQSRLP